MYDFNTFFSTGKRGKTTVKFPKSMGLKASIPINGVPAAPTDHELINLAEKQKGQKTKASRSFTTDSGLEVKAVAEFDGPQIAGTLKDYVESTLGALPEEAEAETEASA